VKAGDTATVIEPEEKAPEENANVIELRELQRSLKSGVAGVSPRQGHRSRDSKGRKKAPAAKAVKWHRKAA